jgi:hypothetical protein
MLQITTASILLLAATDLLSIALWRRTANGVPLGADYGPMIDGPLGTLVGLSGIGLIFWGEHGGPGRL